MQQVSSHHGPKKLDSSLVLEAQGLDKRRQLLTNVADGLANLDRSPGAPSRLTFQVSHPRYPGVDPQPHHIYSTQNLGKGQPFPFTELLLQTASDRQTTFL